MFWRNKTIRKNLNEIQQKNSQKFSKSSLKFDKKKIDI